LKAVRGALPFDWPLLEEQKHLEKPLEVIVAPDTDHNTRGSSTMLSDFFSKMFYVGMLKISGLSRSKGKGFVYGLRRCKLNRHVAKNIIYFFEAS
jgi:hypothetical protein